MEAFEAEAISFARAMIMKRSPYLASILYRVPMTLIPGKSVGVARGARLMVGRELLVSGGEELLSAEIEHAIWHVLRLHERRLSHFEDGLRAQIAGCCEINDDIGGHPHPGDFGIPDGQTAETIYDLLSNAPTPESEPSAHGLGSGGMAMDGEYDDGDASSSISPTEVDLLTKMVAQEIRNMNMLYPGNTPGGLDRWANGVIEPPKVPWRIELASISGTAHSAALGRADYSFRRPSRRHPGSEIVRPSMMSNLPTVGVVIDTSGSMSDSDLAEALGEVVGILRSAGRVIAFSCDAEVSEGREVKNIETIKMVGGGGTDMTAGIAAVIADGRSDVCVVISDGETPWPAVEPGLKTIIAIIGPTLPPTPSWAKTIHCR